MSNIKVISPHKPIDGFSQADLADKWWETIYEIPTNEHFGLFDDERDPNGRRGSVEKALLAQFGESVLFIGGAFGEISTGVGGVVSIERTIVLPNEGIATVFYPLLNGAFDNLVNDPDDPDNFTGDLTVEELTNLVRSVFNKTDDGGLVSNLFASVDDNEVADPFMHRQASTGSFSYTTPFSIENSLLSSLGFTDDTFLDNAGAEPITIKELAEQQNQDPSNLPVDVTIGPAVANGYWVGLDVKGGAHTLNLGGTLEDESFRFVLDITYNILNPEIGTNKSEEILGTEFNDYIVGNNGKDTLTGGDGDNLILGGEGEDIIDGGRGSDELWGDEGEDKFIYRSGYGEDTIFDFSEEEIVELRGFEEFDDDDFEDLIQDITLPSGVNAAEINFGNGDVLKIVGVRADDLEIDDGKITFDD